jgi:hypothetical protein
MPMQCKAKNKNGQPCKMQAIKGSRYCFAHNPATSQARAQARKRGGENRNTPHFADASMLPKKVNKLDDAKKILHYTLLEVSGMDNSIARARVLLDLFDRFLKSFEIGELENRIAALEASLNEQPQDTNR